VNFVPIRFHLLGDFINQSEGLLACGCDLVDVLGDMLSTHPDDRATLTPIVGTPANMVEQLVNRVESGDFEGGVIGHEPWLAQV